MDKLKVEKVRSLRSLTLKKRELLAFQFYFFEEGGGGTVLRVCNPFLPYRFNIHRDDNDILATHILKLK